MSRSTNPATGNYLYYESSVHNMSYNSTWRGKLYVGESKKDATYELHATGNADLNGRTYVALPSGTNVKDPAIIRKYNLN